MAVSRRLRFEIFRRDNHTCRYCGATGEGVKLVIDHVTPQALGGGDEPSNLATACDACNSGKTSIAPGSPLVDQVAEDAVRWSSAIQAAGAKLLGDLDRRNAARAKFEEVWNGWGTGSGDDRRAVERPDGWTLTVDRLLAAGLPMPVLLDCLDVAMRTSKVTASNKFRYMCGIAWKKVTELQEAARAGLDGPGHEATHVTNEEALSSWAEYAREMLDQYLQPAEVERLIARSQEPDDDGTVLTEEAAVINALYEASRYALALRNNVTRIGRTALGLIAGGEGIQAFARSEALFALEDEGDEVDEAWLHLRIAEWVTALLHFKTLSLDAQAGFLECADKFGFYKVFEGPGTEGLADLLFAAQYAATRANGWVQSRICPVGGRDDEPIPCTNEVGQVVWFEDCWVGWCARRECRGHRLCEDHTLAYLTGERPHPLKGEPAVVIRTEDIPRGFSDDPPS